jgi:hypothetical protein
MRKIIIKDTRMKYQAPSYWSDINSFDNISKVDVSFPTSRVVAFEYALENKLIKKFNSEEIIQDFGEFKNNCVEIANNYESVIDILITQEKLYRGDPKQNIYELDKNVIEFLISRQYKVCYLTKDKKFNMDFFRNIELPLIPFSDFFYVKSDENVQFEYGDKTFTTKDIILLDKQLKYIDQMLGSKEVVTQVDLVSIMERMSPDEN